MLSNLLSGALPSLTIISFRRAQRRERKERHFMAIVKRTNKKINKHHGRVDAKKLASLNETDIERFSREDDSDTSALGEPRFVPPRTDVRALRERLGLSQAEFAQRYLSSVRTIQQS